MLTFLFDKVVIPVALIVPAVGAVFLTFFVDYSLLESIGVLPQGLMCLPWKTPGRWAISAIASLAFRTLSSALSVR